MRIGALVAAALIVLAVAMPAAAVPQLFVATLTGPAESPPNNSPGTGFAEITIDPDVPEMRVQLTFSGLTAGTTVAHIHCCTATPGSGTAIPATTVPSFPGFPEGVTAGTYDQTFDMSLASSYNPAFIAAHGGTVESAFDAFFAGVQAGTAYPNIHTTAFQSGEIRGFLRVPEPETYLLIGVAFAVMASLALGRRIGTFVR